LHTRKLYRAALLWIVSVFRALFRRPPPPAVPSILDGRVRFAREAALAAFRRLSRHRERQARRLNTRGLPSGLRRVQTNGIIARAEKRGLIPDPKKLGEFYFGTRHALAVAQRAADFRVESLRPERPERLARRVHGNAQSCSAMRWMVARLERQEREGRGTERIAINPLAYHANVAQPLADASRQVTRACLRAAAEQRIAAKSPNLPRKLRREIARQLVRQVAQLAKSVAVEQSREAVAA
jgi:hypothetical protein